MGRLFQILLIEKYSFLLCIQIVQATWWLLGTDQSHSHYNHHTMNDMDPGVVHGHCDIFPYLSMHQKKLCRESGGKILNTISSGAKLGIEECQNGLQSHRWNCSVIQNSNNVFGQVLSIKSREKAYVHAISAASLAFEITKACARGELEKCSCDEKVRGRDTKGKWQWGGCSEDVKFGTQFTKDFADSPENTSSPEGLMNLHNNEAGRRLLKTSMNVTCKCHGVSGSCTMKVCWRVLSSFRTVAEKINEKFEGAFRMRVVSKDIETNRVSEGERGSKNPLKLKPYEKNMKRPTKKDLVFLDDSPDYCDRNHTLNVLGTKGRICQKGSDGPDGCKLLCCGRGYQTMIREGVESCNCEFVWCCRVECQSCPFKREEYVCN